VIVRRAEGVLLDGPARGEDDKVGDCNSWLRRRAREDGEDGRILSREIETNEVKAMINNGKMGVFAV
jgi:hypothetical protein